MNSYHFSLGNSSDGPIGFCARVLANSPEEAVEILRNSLPRENDISLISLYDKGIEYVVTFFNPEVITVDDIDEFEEIDTSPKNE